MLATKCNATVLEQYSEKGSNAALNGTLFDALGTITGAFASITYDFAKDTVFTQATWEKVKDVADEKVCLLSTRIFS